MADLVQKVRYIVEVDTAALAAWQAELAKVEQGLKVAEGTFKTFGAAARQAGRGIASFGNYLTKAVNPNTIAQLGQLAQAQAGLASNMNRMGDALMVRNEHMSKNLGLNRRIVQSLGERNVASKQAAQAARADAEAMDGLNSRGMTFLKTFGKFQAVKWIVNQVFDSLREGAQTLDIDRTLERQLGNYRQILEDTRDATAGVVRDSQLKRDMALMSSFGLDMNRFSESMELVQKMAIRTGQSADYLSQSFARGISRLSPLILDNLGIQVSLKEANEDYAASVGKSSEELTKNERITALMNHTLGKLRANTEGIDLNNSASASISRFENFFKNVWDDIKEAGGNLFQDLDQALESTTTRSARWGREMQKVAEAMRAVDDLMQKIGLGTEESRANVEREAAWARALQGVGKDKNSSVTRAVLGDPEEWRQKTAAAVKALFTDFRTAEYAVFTDPDIMGSAELELFYKAQFEANKAIEKVKEQYAGVLDDATLARLQTELFAQANETVKGKLQAIREVYGEYATERLRMMAFEQNSNNMAEGFAKFLQSAVDAQIKANVEHAKAEAILNKRRDALYAEVDLMEVLTEMADGKTLIEKQAADLKDKEQKLLRAFRKEQEAYEEERAQGIQSERLVVMERIREELKAAKFTKEAVLVRVEAEEKMFAKWKGASQIARDAEVARLKTMVEQAKVMQLQLTIASAMPGAALLAPIVDELGKQVKDLEVRAERIAAMNKHGFGGGRDRKEKEDKPEFFDLGEWRKGPVWDIYDDLAKRIDEVAIPAINRLRLTWSPDGSADIGTVLGMDPDMLRSADKQLQDIARLMNEMSALEPSALLSFMEETGFNDDTLAAMNAQLAPLLDHLERMTAMSDAFRGFGDALSTVAGGMDMLFGRDINAMVSDLANGLGVLADAFKRNADAYGLTTAAIPAIRAFTKNLIQNRRAQAAVEGAMQAAAAWAAFATFAYPQAAAHSLAALMYFGVAGGAFRLPKGKMRDEKVGNNNAAPTKRADIYINISGPIATTEAERGAMIRDALNAAKREGL